MSKKGDFHLLRCLPSEVPGIGFRGGRGIGTCTRWRFSEKPFQSVFWNVIGCDDHFVKPRDIGSKPRSSRFQYSHSLASFPCQPLFHKKFVSIEQSYEKRITNSCLLSTKLTCLFSDHCPIGIIRSRSDYPCLTATFPRLDVHGLPFISGKILGCSSATYHWLHAFTCLQSISIL